MVSASKALWSCFLLLFLCMTLSAYTVERGSPDYWTAVAKEQLKLNLGIKNHEARAKNMILFIGDGMSIATVTAARFWKAQEANEPDPGRKLLEFETAPFVGLSKTYTDDFTVADSAATATSMLTGVKINSLTIGVDSRVKFGNCSSYSKENDLKNIYSYAKESGLAIGLVTTTSLTHATPGSTYGHVASRYWMSDFDQKDMTAEERKRCPDLASQFLTNAIDFNVVLAGGSAKFRPQDAGGERLDKRNIIKEWETKQKEAGRRYMFVDTKAKLKTAANEKKLDRLLGIFAPDNLPYVDEYKDPKNKDVPSLAEMVDAAVKVLQSTGKGFFLLVEGGRVDHAHHAGFGRRALQEVLGLEAAYSAAKNLVSTDDTLMIATADHSHVFTVGGYPRRGVNLLTFPDQDTEKKGKGKAADGLPFTILLYGNGPGAPIGVKRPDISTVDTKKPEYKQQAIVPLRKETHGADDVAIYAIGPMAHLVNGVREQNYLAHVFMYAGCLGPYLAESNCPRLSASSVTVSGALLLGSLLLALMWNRAQLK